MTITETPPTPGTPESPTRPERPLAPRVWKWVIAAILLIGAVWSWIGIGISLQDLWEAPGKAWEILRQMWPPAFDEAIDRGVLGKVFESVYIAWIGTIIGALLSFPLAFLAASNVAPRAVRGVVRMLFNAIRAVPELIVAMVLLSVTGLGPWAGALAIGLHSVGTLGKLSAEAIETSDEGPLEAIDAAGGRWISSMRWGMVPQVLPTVVAYWLFRFEINVRASAVLGLIGAGGVGAELATQVAFRNWPAVGAVLVFTVTMVLVIDFLSGSVRRRIIAGSARTGEEEDEIETVSRTRGLLQSLTGDRILPDPDPDPDQDED